MVEPSNNPASTQVVIEVLHNGRLVGQTTANAMGKWEYELSKLSVGDHTFRARLDSLNSNTWAIKVVDTTDAAPPYTQEGTPAASDKQRLDYYTVNADIHVIVPADNLQAGDTVKLYWVGRSITLGLDIQTVTNPPKPLNFTISKYEVIDVVGFSTTDVYYTIRRNSSNITSRHLSLSVFGSGHDFELIAPTLNPAQDNLRVHRQTQFSGESTARVRAIGLTEWESAVKTFHNDDYLNFNLDSAWANQNRGKSVLFNYSVRIRNADTHYLFSQLLRLNPF